MKQGRDQRSERGEGQPNAERLAAVYRRPEYQGLEIPRVSGVRLAPWLGLLFGLIGGVLGGVITSGLIADWGAVRSANSGAAAWSFGRTFRSQSGGGEADVEPPQRERSLAGVYLTKVPSAKAKLSDQLYGAGERLATAMAVTADGWFALPTAALPDQRASYTVLTADRRLLTVQGRQDDPVTGLAFIKVSAADLAAVDFAQADRLSIGQELFASWADQASIRYPTQRVRLLQLSAGAAGVSSSEQIDRWLTAEPVNDGLPGTALFNSDGQVAGLLADPAEHRWLAGSAVKQAVSNFLKEQKPYGTYAGLRYVDLSLHRGVARALPAKQTGGALIYSDSESLPGVIPGSPATEAGLANGDVVLKVNGEAVNADRSLSIILQEYQPNDVVTLGVLRGDASVVVPLRLGRWPTLPVDKSKPKK